MKKLRIKKIILSVALIITAFIINASSYVFASTYYISPTGNDANNGLTLETSFRTIQKSANISQPGDTIEINPGTYNEQVTITKSGLVNQPITFHANGQATIDAQNTRAYGIKLAGADYIKIQNLTIKNATNNGILLDNQANYNTIANNTLHNNKESGIKVTNQSCRNTISNNTLHHNAGGTNGYGYRVSAIYIFSYSHYNTITDNDVDSNQSGIWLEGCSSLCAITNNKTHDNSYGGFILVGATNNNTIANNLSYNNKAFGLELGYSAKNNLVKNNTIYNNQTNGIQLNNQAIDNIIKNNIIANNGIAGIYYGIKIDPGSSAQTIFNDIYQNGKTGTNNYGGTAIAGRGDISLDPYFKSTDPQSKDFLKLKSIANGDFTDSPCIDAGDPADAASPETSPRIDIGACDIYTAYTAGLIGSWHFNEITGNTSYDFAPYHNDVALNGASRAQAVSGKALYFDGVNDFAVVSDDESLRLTNTCAIEAVIKIGALSAQKNCIISKPASFWFYIHQTGKVVLEEGLHWEGIWGNTNLKPNAWYHIVGVWDKINGKKQIYINGKLDNEATTINPFSINNQPLSIGNYGAAGGTHYFNGMIDELKIYNRALSETEVKNNYSRYCFTLVNPSLNIVEDYTLTQNIKLELNCKTADKMMISENADFKGAVWQAYAASKNWRLNSGYGEKTIYAKFRNQTGESAAINDTVLYLNREEDYDGDGINNGEEMTQGQDGYITDPAKADTDGDGITDLQEIINGTNPLDSNTTPPSLTIDSPIDGEIVFSD